MDLEQQKNLKPLNISPQFRAQQQQQQLRAPQTPPPPSPRKVKLLCSFGGKILSRPSDGALRYVGGHTRIISVPKDVPFADLMAKMAEVNGGVSPVSFKYQLPNEDLDALISVSCPEDLENMMDEYEKIAESAKIRAFLFSPSENSSADGGVGDMSDTGKRYYEAVNGIGASNESGGGSSVGSLKRKDSGMSAGSSNSGIVEAADGFSEGNIVSPQTLNSGAGSNFAGQGYLDPNQIKCLNNPAVNFATLPVHVSVPAPPAAAQVSNNRTTQPLSQLPPLPPAYQQNIEGNGLNSNPAANQEQGVRLDDCHMCQNMLPHAHSDMQVRNHLGNGSPSGAVNPVFYSQQSEDAMRSKNVVEPRVESQLGAYGFPQVSDAVQYDAKRPFVRKMENVDHARVFLPPDLMGLPPDSQSPYDLFLGNFPQSHQESQIQRQQQQWQQNVVSPHYHLKPEAIVRPVGNDVGSVRNAEGSPVGTEYARPINGMMEGLHLSPNAGFSGQGNASVMPDSSLFIVDSTYSYIPQAGGNAMLAGKPLANAGVVQERNYLMPNEQLPPTTAELNHMRNYMSVDPSQGFTMSGNQGPFPHHLGVRGEPPIPSEGLLAEINLMHNYMAVDPSQGFTMAGNQGPFPHHLGVRGEPPIPSEGLLAMPTYTSGIDPAFTDIVNMAPIAGELREESSQLHSKDMFDHVSVPQSGNLPFGLSNATTSPIGLVETFQEPSPTDSLFCNQDPRKILGGAPPVPPRSRRVGSRESIVPNDSGVQIHLGNSTESDIIAMLEEGGLNHSLDSPNKDLHQDRFPPLKGSGDEQIKQDLQAVAEGVASSVLNSPLPSAPVFFAHDTKGVNTEFKDERKITEGNTEMQRSLASPDTKIEDNKPKVGLHITDDIGRLQIIKNSDLEELRELGSGTFGTVYHGKWRGSDVAIKRINDRCFSGKPSEQERMRADFWNEACKLANLHHPNVVAFYGVVLDGPGGSVATVTEYMVNGSLRTALQKNDKTFDRRKRLLIAMDVAFGMEYLHGRNIVHFDLKSDNLLVNLRDPQRPICKVGDLGLSKVKCQTLISGGVRGTLPWMAPELLNGSSSLVSEKVDVFSFGIVMWELLTGEEPYADLHYGAIIGGIVSNTLRPPVPEFCDPEWKALMERCWSADPSERPSFTDIAERLRSMATSIPQKGHAQTQVQK